MRRLPLISVDSPIRRLRAQKRFLGERLTILLPHNDYYVQGECARALVALGHRVVRVAIGAEGENLQHQEVLRRLLQAVVAHRPDMLLSVNYTGFDRAGFFDEIIEAMGLPCAVWFVDSPFFLAEGFLPPAKTMVTGFVWDASYLAPLRAHGMQQVSHLPLATCRHVFARAMAPAPTEPPLPVAFVGHSLAKIEQIWHKLTPQKSLALAALIASDLQTDRQALHRHAGHMGPPLEPKIRPLALGNYRASKALRARCLGALPQDSLHVFGDEAWRSALPSAHVHGGCTYGEETARIFRHAAINVNITNFQMPATVNQRVFDVPAAGAFLLTDRQSELAALYEDDVEVVTFASPDELADKAAYYGKRPKSRARIVARGRERTLLMHTYEHRMHMLLQVMRARYGDRPKRTSKESQCDSPAPPN